MPPYESIIWKAIGALLDAFNLSSDLLRFAYRYYPRPDSRDYFFGFRVVVSPSFSER